MELQTPPLMLPYVSPKLVNSVEQDADWRARKLKALSPDRAAKFGAYAVPGRPTEWLDALALTLVLQHRALQVREAEGQPCRAIN